jgi:hydrogenase maturation protein HypF
MNLHSHFAKPDDRFAAEIRVRGRVQGVGFRPTVWRYARELGLSGEVLNDSSGVLIRACGGETAIAALIARIDGIEVHSYFGDLPVGFVIADSRGGGAHTQVAPDASICRACAEEVADPFERRYRYPLANCTHCGPRLSIVAGIPYDRANTTMAPFAMCPACRAEYDDPADRRFHAEAIACHVCGPKAKLVRFDGRPFGFDQFSMMDDVDAAGGLMKNGEIVAVKGIGGYHLAVDATNGVAVAELRRRKARDDKPFAVMASDLDAARELCELDDAAAAALLSPRRPIVLAPRRRGARLAGGIAPGSPDLGVFLPYSPLHHLLLAGVGGVLVMTSGNHSDEPIAHDDEDAAARLGPMVDGLLTHDRPIHIRCDDSVIRATGSRLQLLRRSRGYAPEPLPLPFTSSRSVLALGGELKSTVAVARGGEVIASHHIGDLEHLATYQSFLQAVDHLPALTGTHPDVVAHDLHPEYLSTKFALELELPTIAIQHHHAHVAACMVEHGRTEPVLGIAFDGLGYGTDGSLWGGEFLLADFAGFRRVGHLRGQPMPGGARAIREPWRMAAVWAHAAGLQDAPALDPIDPGSRSTLLSLAAGAGVATTTSMGRLFDAVAVLVGCRTRVSYEAQSAIELEALARSVDRADASVYEGTVDVAAEGDVVVLDPARLVARIVEARVNRSPAALVAACFHETIGRAAADVAIGLARAHAVDAVVLTGGVFQNVRLTEVVETEVSRAGLQVLVHEQVPPNDGGLSIGQAAIAAHPGASS